MLTERAKDFKELFIQVLNKRNWTLSGVDTSEKSCGDLVEYLVKEYGGKGIELRIVDRFYPSSKLCSKCGKKKLDLKLKDRVYICGCGNQIDRDFNAAVNLEKCAQYRTAM